MPEMLSSEQTYPNSRRGIALGAVRTANGMQTECGVRFWYPGSTRRPVKGDSIGVQVCGYSQKATAST